MRFTETSLSGAWLVEVEPHRDERGFFARAFCEEEFAAHGLPIRFPQCNLSRNDHVHTLRGMHYARASHPEAKIVRCTRGAIYDVIVDIRPASPTAGRWVAAELSAENGHALAFPEGFAHGFLTLVDGTDVFYQMGASFQADAARGFRWNDPSFDVRWPSAPAVISSRDATYPDFEKWKLDG